MSGERVVVLMALGVLAAIFTDLMGWSKRAQVAFCLAAAVVVGVVANVWFPS